MKYKNHQNTQKVLHFVYVKIYLARPMFMMVAGYLTKGSRPGYCHEQAKIPGGHLIWAFDNSLVK